MKPLTAYEMTELTQAMNGGTIGAPVGSLWSNAASPDLLFMVLIHANLPDEDGPTPAVILQAIPSGEAWVQPYDAFTDGSWQGMGFVWDRDSRD